MDLSIIISLLALGLSALTAWLTWFHRGTVKMSHPALVFFGPEDTGRSKVFMRMLLYCTSNRGRCVESIFLKVRRGNMVQHFNMWVYGQTNALVVGGGLFVGPEGVAANHHFSLPPTAPDYDYLAGTYAVEVCAKFVGASKLIQLWKHTLTVNDAEATVLLDGQGGLEFHWDPDADEYNHRLDIRFIGNKLETALGLAKLEQR